MSVVQKILPQVNISDEGLMYLLRRYINNAQVENLYYVNSGIDVLQGSSLNVSPGQFYIITNIFGKGQISTFGGVEINHNSSAHFNAYLITANKVQETTGTLSVAVEWHLFQFSNG